MAEFEDIEDTESVFSDSDDEDLTKPIAGGAQKKKIQVKKGSDDEDDEEDDESDVVSAIDSEDMDVDADDDELESVENRSVASDNEPGVDLDADEANRFIEDSDADDDDDDDEDDDDYLKKFDENVQRDIIKEYHPELHSHNYEEVDALCTIVRDEAGNIIDALHRTVPIVSRYEKARILGERAKQLNAGATPFVEVPDGMIDGYLIAWEEFNAKKIPFIVQRPMPNGGSEYWRLQDLEVL